MEYVIWALPVQKYVEEYSIISIVLSFKDSTSHMFKMNPDTFRTGEIKNERILSPSDFC
jgi:hypothetical protein